MVEKPYIRVQHLSFTEFLRKAHPFTYVGRNSLYVIVHQCTKYTCGLERDFNTRVLIFGWVSEYFWKYSVLQSCIAKRNLSVLVILKNALSCQVVRTGEKNKASALFQAI